MTDMDKDFDELEQLFAETRKGRAQLPAGLSQRILADADQVQAGFVVLQTVPESAGFWGQIKWILGGWPAMGGLVAAGVAGIWIGLAPPSFLPDPTQFLYEEATEIDLIDIDGLALALAEEG